MKELTAERVRELLNYDPETGIFTWRVSRGGVVAGAIAGANNGKGYLRIVIDNRKYRAHRLAWLMTFGEWPDDQIDHMDGDKLNNRIVNLRECSNSKNHQNLGGAYSNNAIGVLGVYYFKKSKKWRAQITHDKKQHHLGSFETPEQAHEAYCLAKRELHKFQPILRGRNVIR